MEIVKTTVVGTSKIVDTPDTLVVVVNRFDRMDEKMPKPNTSLIYGGELNIGDTCTASCLDTVYQLVGVVEHIGETMIGGHYRQCNQIQHCKMK